MTSDEAQRTIESYRSYGPTKTCTICGNTKPLIFFTKSKKNKDGRAGNCKECSNQRNKHYRHGLPEDSNIHNQMLKESRRIRTWAQRTIYHHRKNKYKVKISVDEIEELAMASPACAICGCNISWDVPDATGPRHNSPTLDRVDNEPELRADNVAIVCHKCNVTKQDRTMLEFIDYCQLVLKNAKINFEPIFELVDDNYKL